MELYTKMCRVESVDDMIQRALLKFNFSTHAVDIDTKGTQIMEITDIKVRKLFDDGPMKAIVSVTFDNELALHDVKVINARDRYFIVMPSRKNPDETYRDIVHPINTQFRSRLEAGVLEAYKKAVAEAEEATASDETAPDDATGTATAV